ncbi:MAG: hypothetical protein NTX53_20595 [candidate division WOR-3 bacterium]|nr:hypothetical protein [candidate division WOR-3 bacterium]
MMPLPRLATGDSMPIAFVVTDPGREQLKYGMCYEAGEERWMDSPGECGQVGFQGDSLFYVRGVSIDTFMYEQSSTKLYAYVASRNSLRIQRFRFDVTAHTLSYLNDIYSTNVGRIDDVCCARAPDGVSSGAYVAVVNSCTSVLTILGVSKTNMSVTTLAEVGEPGGGDNQFSQPEGVWIVKNIDPQNGYYDIYVADRGNSRVAHLHFDPEHNQLSWQTALVVPGADFVDVTANASGYVYAVDYSGGRLVVFAPDLAEVAYDYYGSGFDHPVEASVYKDELVVTEWWSDNAGIQYFRIVPEIQDLRGSGMFDATIDSSFCKFNLSELPGYVTVSIKTDPERVLLQDSLVYPGDTVTVWWDGRDTQGHLAIPDVYQFRVSVEFRQGNQDSLLTEVKYLPDTVKGTTLSSGVYASATWDTLHEPYVLSGHDFNINGGSHSATLTIQPGVRVMFHDSVVSRTIYVHTDDRIEALGTAQKPVYFMLHRTMAEGFNPAKRGWWGGIHFYSGSNGAKFNNCAFENGGYNVVYSSTPNSGVLVDFDSCQFRGACGRAIQVDSDSARERIDIDNCHFEYCADYPIFTLRAPAVADVSATCTFENNGANNQFNAIRVYAGTGDGAIASSCTWRNCGTGFFYLIMEHDLTVMSSTGGNPVLTIEPGVTIRLRGDCGIQVGSLTQGGAIVALGQASAPITFRGADSVWNGMELAKCAGACSLRYCVFREGVQKQRATYHSFQYYPMLWCHENQASPWIYRCKFLDAERDIPNQYGTGICIKKATPHIEGCKFHNNDAGIIGEFSGGRSCEVDYCQIDSGGEGYRILGVAHGALPKIQYSNIFQNDYGAINYDGDAYLNAQHNWWGPDNQTRPGWPGNGNNDVYGGYVSYDPAESLSYPMWCTDVQVCSIIRPSVFTAPDTLAPMGTARNNFEEQVILTATMRIGSVYADTVLDTLAAYATDSIVFDTVALDTGTYTVVFKVSMAGDEIPANDSIVQTVHVREERDVAADAVLSPPDWILSDTTVVDTPVGVVHNYYHSTLEFPVTFTIGENYTRTETCSVDSGQTDTLWFPPCTLAVGHYSAVFYTDCEKDTNRHNDTISYTVAVRESIDAAAAYIIEPAESLYTVEDTLDFAVRVANNGNVALLLPVNLYVDNDIIQTVSVNVDAHDSATASFDSRTLVSGQRWLKYEVDLDGDDNPANDTVAKGITVKAGDFWVEQPAPEESVARLCWDGDQHVYAAARNELAIERFDMATRTWTSLACPPFGGPVSGITALDGQIYALGVPGAGLSTTRRGPAPAAQPFSPARAVGTQSPSGPRLDQEPSLYRYEADGDSWVFVTGCPCAATLGQGAALVGDDTTKLYLLDGTSSRLYSYHIEADVWDSVQTPVLFNYRGAADWGRGGLYALSDSLNLWRYAPGGGWWPVSSPGGPGLLPRLPSYDPAICCDPVLDRLFTFYFGSLGGITNGMGFRERSNQYGGAWMLRAGLSSETTEVSLCFGSTQAYCLDGRGGFWRYRPAPLFDAAAVTVVVPDTVPRESSFVPKGVIQNGWNDSLQIDAHLSMGAYHDVQTVIVPPQTWDTVEFAPESLQPGIYQETLRTTLIGDNYPFNDTARRNLTVRYRRDAAAVEIVVPRDWVPAESLIHPVGVIENRLDDTMSIWAYMTIGSQYADSELVTLAALSDSEVEFDTLRLPVGEYEAELRVSVAGDEVPENDHMFGEVEAKAGDYWWPLAPSLASAPLLVAGGPERIYAFDKQSAEFDRYGITSSDWDSIGVTGYNAQISACRHGQNLYVLGKLSGTGPYAVITCDTANFVWHSFGGPLPPLKVTDYSRLAVSSNGTVYLLARAQSGPGICFWRSNGGILWASQQVLAETLSSRASVAYDGADHIYLLTGSMGRLYKYGLTQNQWDTALTSLQLAAPTTSALTCDSARQRLYAFWASPNALGSFWSYDVVQDTWQPRQAHPCPVDAPALAAQNGYVYGHSGAADTAFAVYVPMPDTDVAALAILSPPDTVRSDSFFRPTGVVQNLSPWLLGFSVEFFTTSRQLLQYVELEPGASDTVYFDSIQLPMGIQQVTLTTLCQGDQRPANDSSSTAVIVRLPQDIAALEVLSPVGEIRSDSQVVPTGLVENLFDESLDVWVHMRIGSVYRDSQFVSLPPSEPETVAFVATYLPLGLHEVCMSVLSDEVPENDSVTDSCEVTGGNCWIPRADYLQHTSVNLVDYEPGGAYAIGHFNCGGGSKLFSRYAADGDTWHQLPESPLEEGASAACRSGTKVYAVGGFDMPGVRAAVRRGSGPAFSNSNDGIVCFDEVAGTWDTVTVDVDAGPGLYASGDDLYGLGVDPDPAGNWSKYVISEDSWYDLSPMPESLVDWTSGAHDGGDHVYVLTGSSGELYRYDISQDTWVALRSLESTTPAWAALACDATQGCLYAFWTPDGSPDCFFSYSIEGDSWHKLAAFPYPYQIRYPSVSAWAGKVFASSSRYPWDTTENFAQYVPVPSLDVAALEILGLPDTVRCDTLVRPLGVVLNSGNAYMHCDARFVCGSDTLHEVIDLQPWQQDTVAFDSTYLDPGLWNAELVATCSGDENPADDTVHSAVMVEGPWEPRTPPAAFYGGRLDADSAWVYGASEEDHSAAMCSLQTQTWEQLTPTPFDSGCIDLSQRDGRLYAVGIPCGFGSSSAVYTILPRDTVWQLVTDSLPVALDPSDPAWIVATADGIYLEPAYGQEFWLYRFDSLGGGAWEQKHQVPMSVHWPCAVDWDRADAIYLMSLPIVAAAQTTFYLKPA